MDGAAPTSPRRRRLLAALLLVALGLLLIVGAGAALALRYRPALLARVGLQLLSDHPLRRAYVAEVHALAGEAERMEAQGAPLPEIARAMHRRRREIGVKYKDMTPAPLRQRIYEINRRRYGDPLGPSFEYLEKKNTHQGVVDYRAIITGASRTNASIDKLLSER